MKAFLIILLVIIGIAVIEDIKETKNSESNKKMLKLRGSIIDRNMNVIASYKNGKVYLDKGSSVLGFYTSEGKVYNKAGKYIGYAGESIIMDRTYEYDNLKTILPNDSSIQNPKYCPGMTMQAGENYRSCIETPEEFIAVFISDKGNDLVGSSAAYLVAINEGLILKQMENFYLFSNIQADCYFLSDNDKNRLSLEYSNYFRNKYGRSVWYSL